jgi:RNA 2',3'-cyclic 3'-phosphodiesterase
MKRLFVAVPIPDQIKEALLNTKTNIPGARWIDKDHLHLTLKFLGEVDGQNFRIIRDSLSEIIIEKFLLKIKGVGFYPPGNFPKVLWAGVENQPQLTILRNKIESNLYSLGIKREGRKFKPHITLSRLKNSQVSRVSEFLSTFSSFKTESFLINEFRLYSSKLYPRGAVHTIEGIYTF